MIGNAELKENLPRRLVKVSQPAISSRKRFLHLNRELSQPLPNHIHLQLMKKSLL